MRTDFALLESQASPDRPSDKSSIKNDYGAIVERYGQGNPDALGHKLVPVPVCAPKISHILTRDRTLGLDGERLATDRLNHGTAFRD